MAVFELPGFFHNSCISALDLKNDSAHCAHGSGIHVLFLVFVFTSGAHLFFGKLRCQNNFCTSPDVMTNEG